MKLNNTYTSTTYDLEKGTELKVVSSYNNDFIKVTPNSDSQGDEEVKSRILSSVETQCRDYAKDEIIVSLNDCRVVDADVDFSDDETIITLRGRHDNHGLIITILNNK